MGFMEWWDGFWVIYNIVIFSIGVNVMLVFLIYVILFCGLLLLVNVVFMGIGVYIVLLLMM